MPLATQRFRSTGLFITVGAMLVVREIFPGYWQDVAIFSMVMSKILGVF